MQQDDHCEDTSSIEVSFPAPVHISSDQTRRLVDLVNEICDGYEDRHSDRVMWAAGIGGRPLNIHDDDLLDFDMSVLAIDCYERERFGSEKRRTRIRPADQDRLIAEAVEAERERCAKVAEGFDDGAADNLASEAAKVVAAAIRGHPTPADS